MANVTPEEQGMIQRRSLSDRFWNNPQLRQSADARHGRIVLDAIMAGVLPTFLM